MKNPINDKNIQEAIESLLETIPTQFRETSSALLSQLILLVYSDGYVDGFKKYHDDMKVRFRPSCN